MSPWASPSALAQGQPVPGQAAKTREWQLRSWEAQLLSAIDVGVFYLLQTAGPHCPLLCGVLLGHQQPQPEPGDRGLGPQTGLRTR